MNFCSALPMAFWAAPRYRSSRRFWSSLHAVGSLTNSAVLSAGSSYRRPGVVLCIEQAKAWHAAWQATFGRILDIPLHQLFRMNVSKQSTSELIELSRSTFGTKKDAVFVELPRFVVRPVSVDELTPLRCYRDEYSCLI